MITASCSGHGAAPVLPGTSTTQNGGKAAGAGTSRPMSLAVAPSGWATTGTLALSLNKATDLGALDANKTMTIRVGLQMQNAAAAQQALQAGTRLSASQAQAEFAPSAAQVQAVVSYLQSQGLANVKAEADGMLVSATGTAAQVQTAFNTKLEAFSLNGLMVFANTAPALVPQALGGNAIAVLGLNNLPIKTITQKPTNAGCNAGLTASSPVATPCFTENYAKDWQTDYDAGNTASGSSTTIAVMATGDVSGVVSDLRYAESYEGLPQVPVSVVQVGLPSPANGADEWDLDTQSSTGIAGNVSHLYIYTTTSLTDSDIANEFNQWRHDDAAQLANASFGECEDQAYLDGSMLVDDQILVQAAVQGQTMFAATGDVGSGCPVVVNTGTPASGPPLVSYPSSSPYIVAVGGTSLYVNPDGTYLGEMGWMGGGGGVSQFEYSPYWESPAQPISTTPAGLSFRGVPDISMSADPNATAANVYISGTWTGVGGTSLATPLAVGAFARLQSAHNNALGFAAIPLYHVYATNPSATELSGGPPPTQLRGGFHDILSGSNGQYQVTPGYDYVTGLGTIDISKMNATIGN